MNKVLILANHYITIYAFRKELVEELLANGDEVYIALPYSEDNSYFKDMGCKIVETPLERRKTNPLSDFKLLFQYVKLIKKIKPDIILTYTIKPNTYGGIAAGICRVKTIHTVTGLGSIYIREMWQKHIAVILNKIAFKYASKIIFLNNDNKLFYEKLKIVSPNQDTIVVPGSGVNLDEFKFIEGSNHKGDVTFTFIGRILKDKGIEEYLEAAEEILENYDGVKFEVAGFVDEVKYIDLLKEYEDKRVISYLGNRTDIKDVMANSSCIVLPSYGEGRGTVLQEGAAVGRPLITCNVYGCKENVDENYNGFLCKVADKNSLKMAMEKFINIPSDEKILMGKRSREKAEKEFNREDVIKTYTSEIQQIIEAGY